MPAVRRPAGGRPSARSAKAGTPRGKHAEHSPRDAAVRNADKAGKDSECTSAAQEAVDIDDDAEAPREDYCYLREQLIVAVEQQLNEQRRSMAEFLDVVATLCQNEQNSHGISQALRGIFAKADVLPDKVELLDVTGGKVADGVTAPPPLAISEALKMKVPGERQVSEQDEEELHDEGDNVDIPEEVKKDFQVSPLPFIDNYGTVIPPPSKVMVLLGPKFRDLLAALQAPLRGHKSWQPMTGHFATFVRSSVFQTLGSLVIMMNYVFIIIQSDNRIETLQETQSATMENVGYFFTIFYLVECLINIIVQRVDFFFGHEAGWCLFDLFIVLAAILEVALKWIGITGMNTGFLRIMRFMKMSRVLRMFSAMRAFKEIKIMIDALTGCLLLFVFSSLLLAIFISVFAIFIVQGAAGYLESNPDLSFNDIAHIRTLFGSVFTGMLTLYKCALGGADWGKVHQQVSSFGIIYDYLLLLYINFSFIAFFNIVIGVFCEKAMSLAAVPTTQELMSNRSQQEHADAEDLLAQLHDFISEESTYIDKEEFDEFIADQQVMSYFEVRGVKPSSVARVYQSLCDINKTRRVDLKTFVSLLVRLEGPASAIDLHALSVRQLHSNHVARIVHHSHRQDVKSNHLDVLTQHDLVQEQFERNAQMIQQELRDVQSLLNALHEFHGVPVVEATTI